MAAVAKATPLWYYVLAEAQTQEGSASLGALGSLLVGGVFLELLLADKGSYLHVPGGFNPATELHLPPGMKLETMADLVMLVQPETVGRLGLLQL